MPDTYLKPQILILVAFLFSSHGAYAAPYGSGWYGEVQAGLGHEDNISRSFLSIDEVSDEIAYLSIGGGHSEKVGNNAQLVLYGYLGLNMHDEYDDLDNLALSLGGNYTWQRSPAWDAPWFIADASATVLKYDNSNEREGVLFEGDFSANKRLGTQTTGHLGYRYADLVLLGKTSAEEENDAAFDVATHEAYIGIDYELRRNVFLYGEYAFRHGGVWSNVSFDAGIIEYDAETIDTVFDDCAAGDLRCQPRYAGRTVADIHRLNVGVAFPLGPVNIDVSGVYYDTRGDNGEDYKNWYLSAGLIWNF